MAKKTSSKNQQSAIGNPKSLVAVIMGSKSDWETMAQADQVLSEFGIAHECQVVSAHRTPAWMAEYASTASARSSRKRFPRM